MAGNISRKGRSDYFKDLQDVSVDEILAKSIALCRFHEKYTSRPRDGRDCWECGYMHRLVKFPDVKPTGVLR
jgi:hypothetical protein